MTSPSATPYEARRRASTGRTYREYAPPAELEPLVACLWEGVETTDRPWRLVPDGCLDLIWVGGRDLVVAGADTGPRVVDLPAGTRSQGIRLRPGAAGAVLGMPASELRDREVPADLVWGAAAARLRESVTQAESEESARCLELLARAVASRQAVPDPLVRVASWHLSLPGASISRVAAELGVSERQLHRRTTAAVGYGPKLLARVARLRRFVALTEDSLAIRAIEAGYASQAHMSDEVRRLTGVTAVRFLEEATLTGA
jgi:methylphosphotriester-DNA--protein-cysteine methyltransferase